MRIAAPFVIALLSLVAATTRAQPIPPPPPIYTLQPPPAPGLVLRWNAVRQAAEHVGFAGWLHVIDGGLSYGEDVNLDHLLYYQIWRFASVTKQIVAVAVMQQVEDGRLALDVPVARYAPDLGIANADTITIRQLLQHTSGLPNPEDGPKTADGRALVQYERAAPKPAPGLSPICRADARAAPPAAFNYNNCDYEVLGAILEKVTGEPLAALLKRRIFTPAGMTGTRLLAPGDDAGRPGYDAAGKPDSAIDPGRFGAAAGLAGPAADLAAFDRALMDGRLLKPASRAEMWRGDPKLGYAALGQWSYTITPKGCAAPQHIVERRGEIGGVQVRNLIMPERQIAVIAFADRPVEFGEPWQGRGLTHDLLAAALCPAAPAN